MLNCTIIDIAVVSVQGGSSLLMFALHPGHYNHQRLHAFLPGLVDFCKKKGDEKKIPLVDLIHLSVLDIINQRTSAWL